MDKILDKIILMFQALKGMYILQIFVGISILVGTFFYVGGDRIFDSIDVASEYRCKEKIQDIKDSLVTDKWQTIRRIRNTYESKIDSLEKITNGMGIQ